ncbi:MAG: Spore germination protein B3 precursor [Firmicutes bacterium ADurb.Bin373]|nr:Ger(x)C family spore germination protein [Bacillota bacterium]OQA11171.1 MAG: Spore germination protein B3 precursor [Firmicutes bacterium ADurb.Bin373]
MKRIIPAFILLILSALLYGCWDRREINDLGLIVGVAYDQAELAGKTGVELTLQVANPAVMATGQGGTIGAGGTGGTTGAGPFWTISETGVTIREAISKMNYRVPKHLFFGHARVYVFGEKAVRGGITPFLDRWTRSPESRDNIFLAVSKGDASRILEQKSPVFQSTALALNNIFLDKDGWQAIMAVNMADFEYRLSTGITSPLAPVVEVIPQASLTAEEIKAGISTTVAITGLAAFDPDGRLVDYLDERESMGLLWVINRARNREMTIPHFVEGKEESISLRQVNAKSKIAVSIGDDGLPVFEIETHAIFDVLEQFCIQRGLSDVSIIKNIEEMAGSQMINEIEAAVKKSQQLNTDVFGFGEEFRRQYHREWPQYKDHWREIYPELNVIIECEAHVRDRELSIEPPGSRTEGGGQ